MSARPSFRDALAAGPMVIDGAMGTSLHARGEPYTVSYEGLNLEKPELIRNIHESFLTAGARVIETNTFGANPTRLARHGLEGQLRAINAAGVARAKEACAAVSVEAFVAGSIGPSGLDGIENLSDEARDRLRDGFRAQAEALAEAGADILIIETMRQPEEMRLALEASERSALPMVALASFRDDGKMSDGTTAERMLEMMLDRGAEVVGANCGAPALMLRLARKMKIARPDASIAMVPSAGLPRTPMVPFRGVDDRLVYPITPADFGTQASTLFTLGVAMVGGCCGTTPEHVRAIATARGA